MSYKRKNTRVNSNGNGNTYDYQSYRRKRIGSINELVEDKDSSKKSKKRSASKDKDYKKQASKSLHKESKKDSQENERRRLKRNKRTSFIVIAFVIIYIPSVLKWLYGDSISTAIIYSGKIEDSINTDALIVRDEILIEAPFDGKYIPTYEEGEKVAANSVIATVIRNSASDVLNKVSEINKKIIFAKQEKGKVLGIFNKDIEKLDNEIGYKIDLLIDDINNNRMNNIKKLKTEINEIIQRKAVIIGDDETEDVYIQSLNEQKENLEKQMAQSIEEERTEFSGLVSYLIDGYEEILKPEAIQDITPDVFNKMLNDVGNNAGNENRETNTGKPFAKITRDLGCYLVICKDADTLNFLKKGDSILIRINDINKTIQGIVEYISEEQSGKKVVSLKINKYTNELSALRKLNIDLIKSTYEGLMVPVRSLIDVNKTKMTANIIIIKANNASVREVIIKGLNSEYAVITSANPKKGVSLYDTYIMNPKNIYDEQVISQ